MPRTSGPKLPAFLWPALAAETASAFASAVAKEFVNLAIGTEPEADNPEPGWTTHNRVVLELETVRLRDFSTSREGTPTLVCAPFALHGSTITDFAPQHSLVATLQGGGLDRVFVTDWRSASPQMRFLSIDNYLADLNVLVDELGGTVDLVGLCQGGWMALLYAARFPGKVRKLVLAGAPIDIAAGGSQLSDLGRNTPTAVFEEMVDLGGGRLLGQSLLQFWAPNGLDKETIHRMLQATSPDSAAFHLLEARFRDWHAWTVNLPGNYFLQVVEQLFKENQLAGGRFVALGQRIALSKVRCPLFLLAGRDDEVVAPEQLFAMVHLVDSQQCQIRKAVTCSDHLGLFMGKRVLSEVWPEIANWLTEKPESVVASD